MAKAPRSLAGKVVAITGGARGIGRATAAALITQGARVSIGDIETDLAAQTASELGGGTIGLPLDVTDRASFDRFLTETESRLGPLDVLINNAGIMPIGPFVDETDTTMNRMIDINLKGVLFGSKLALERFVPRNRGHLVNVASVAGKGGAAGGVTYCATKHAVVGLSEAIRAEVRAHRDRRQHRDAGRRQHRALIRVVDPIRGFKVAEPEDVAAAIVDALQTGRVDVYVPKSVGGSVPLHGRWCRARLPTRSRRCSRPTRCSCNADPKVRNNYLLRTGDLAGQASAVPERASTEPAPEKQPV